MLPTAIAAWDHQQWGIFVATLAAGLLAVLFFRPVARARADVRQRRMFALAAPEIAAHFAAGPGSLATLREVGPGSIVTAEPLVDQDVADELAAALGAALERFRVDVEPAMRKARLWLLQGGETYAAAAVRDWHLVMCEEPTGEYPMVLDGARA